MIRTTLLALSIAVLPTLGTLAQEPPPQGGKPVETPAAKAAPARPTPQLVNIRIDLTLTEEGEGAAAAKTVTMLVADHQLGRIRSGGSGIVVNVDARPEIVPDGRVRVMLSLEYSPGGGVHQVSQSLNTLLVSGKPLLVSQSADPKTDRRVKAELTATIAK